MKSKTFSCERTLFKKNLLRFSPFWGLYTLGLLLFLMIMTGGEFRSNTVPNLAGSLQIMSVLNAGYGLLVAELLFGDLFDMRMCSGFHALPMKRERLFAVNVILGLVFSLIPTLIFGAVSLPLVLAAVETDGAILAWGLWLLGTNLQFLFSFGLGVLCMLLTGNRLAAALMFGGLNSASMLLYLLLDTFFTPLLPGVVTPSGLMRRLCPVLMSASTEFIHMDMEVAATPEGRMMFHWIFTPGEGWGYLTAWALAGIGFLALALLLYKRRKLECAGDFLAIPRLRPLIPVLAGLACAAVEELVLGEENLFLSAVALGVGWFVAWMLMERTTRVFGKKQLLGLGCLAAAVALAMGVTKLDPMGIADWVPEKVRYAYVADDYYGFLMDSDEPYYLTEEEDISEITDIHRAGLHWSPILAQEEKELAEDGEMLPTPTVRLQLVYGLENGREVRRVYHIPMDADVIPLVKKTTSRPPYVLHELEPVLREHLDAIEDIQINGQSIPAEYQTLEDYAALRDAILADCAAGAMSPWSVLHDYPAVERGEESLSTLQIYLVTTREGYGYGGFLEAFAESTHTIQWLEERGIIDLLLSLQRPILP